MSKLYLLLIAFGVLTTPVCASSSRLHPSSTAWFLSVEMSHEKRYALLGSSRRDRCRLRARCLAVRCVVRRMSAARGIRRHHRSAFGAATRHKDKNSCLECNRGRRWGAVATTYNLDYISSSLTVPTVNYRTAKGSFDHLVRCGEYPLPDRAPFQPGQANLNRRSKRLEW
jgi:hypothetical protein